MINSETHENLSEAIADVDGVEVTTEDDLPDLETALDALATTVADAGLVDNDMELDDVVIALISEHSLAREAWSALADIHSYTKELKYLGGVAGAAYQLSHSKALFCTILARWVSTEFGEPDDQTHLPLG
jgi:hypothetical protein